MAKEPLYCTYYMRYREWKKLGLPENQRCHSRGYRTLQELDLQGAVCGTCLRPSFFYFQARLHPCPECFRAFDAPGEDLCKSCSPSDPYRGWRWAAKELKKIEDGYREAFARPLRR